MNPDVTPVLAVVGHPNKGKSSLVATLAQDDSVTIASDPGTTRQARAYPMRVDGQLLYTLVDTPGFQRARHVLAWLQARAEAIDASAADRPRLVAEFIAERNHATRYPDECELLRPIVEGAGILYVVDGGVPYGPEYEAEMEVLRWAGRPSMAVINPIDCDDHVEDWRAALGQFFRAVRVLDAVHADYATRADLLRAFGQLEPEWLGPIEQALEALEEARRSKRRAIAREIAELVSEALVLVVEKKIGLEEDPARHRRALEEEYRNRLRQLESGHRRAVQSIADHRGLESREAELEILEDDLFSEGTWLTFGLRRRDLVAAGAAGGAATGGVLDVALGGASLLVGAAAGAAVGGVLGFFGASRLAELRVVDRPLGGKLLRYGPSQNANFPFVLLGRARYHADLLAVRTHAMRGVLDLEADGPARMILDGGQRKALERIFSALRRSRLSAIERAATVDRLTEQAEAILVADELHSSVSSGAKGDSPSRHIAS